MTQVFDNALDLPVRTSFDGLATPHDSENRLTGIGTGVTYTYDADGRRVSKTVSGITTRFHHAGDIRSALFIELFPINS